MRLLRPALFFCCCLLCACSAKTPPQSPAVMALSLDGPPLAVAGHYAGMDLEGEMERPVMTGKGTLRIKAVSGGDFDCLAAVDSMPTQKARVRGYLLCTGERRLPFSLRNTGPDQGVGIARESLEGDLMVLFYHPSADEAKRRLPEVLADMERARGLKR